jgi:hypothetical protein
LYFPSEEAIVWLHTAQVQQEHVEAFFEPLPPEQELQLPTAASQQPQSRL